MPSSSPASATPATVSSAAAAEAAGIDAAARPRRLNELVPPALLALLVGALAVLMFATHRDGHWWGDDWALYVRQAKGLLDGHPNRVLVENEFTVGSSDGAAFSPPLYPWGFPLLLAPFIAIVGVDLDALAVVPVLCACVFACCWFVLARRRVGLIPALAGVAAVTITPLLLSWTELIQSEWPFLAAAGIALLTLDTVVLRDRSLLTPGSTRWLGWVLVGLTSAAAFSVRREGLAMLAAIAAAQLASVVAARAYPWRLDSDANFVLLARLAVPHATFLVTIGLLQITLPSTVVPQYDGTSVTNVWKLRGRIVRNLAQVSGFQRPWDRGPMVLGSERLGWMVVALFLGLAIAGMVLSVVRYSTRDLHLAAYAIAALLIGGSFRSPINRYVCTVAPVLMLLAIVALDTSIRRFARAWVATLVLTLAMVAIVAGNMANAKLRVESATRARDAGAIEWGPTHPDAIAMFEAVESLTEPDEIVAAPKARAMVLETGRPSIQVDDYRPIPPDVDIKVIVVEPNTRIASQIAGNPAFTALWHNPRFIIYGTS